MVNIIGDWIQVNQSMQLIQLYMDKLDKCIRVFVWLFVYASHPLDIIAIHWHRN